MKTKSEPIGEILEKNTAELSDKEQIEQLKQMLNQLTQKVNGIGVSEKKEKALKTAPIKSISPNTYVKIMSLVSDKLNLSTRPHGKGKTFGFTEFGQIKSVFYSELLDIIENHPNFFAAGYFYILDENVVNAGNHNELYQKILKKEQMEMILSNADNAIALFEGANEKQQKVIVQFFIDKIMNEEKIDFNLIRNISEISGIDIVKKTQEMKESNDNIKK